MKNSIKISIIGGDLRALAVAKRLALSYDNINLFGIRLGGVSEMNGVEFKEELEEALAGAGAVILPLPSSVDGVSINCPLYEPSERPKLSEILRHIPDGCLIFGGKLPESFVRSAEQKGFCVKDYFESEDFQIKNAYTTAEAALSVAMNRLDRNIRGSRIAITGYGRIAKHLCSLLLSLGADVTVAARRESDLFWAESFGCKTLRITPAKGCLSPLQSGYDVIYNTVPIWLFDRDFLVKADRNTFIVDLASAPGGVDIRAAKELGANVSWATSLPGKYAPRSAGELIADCVARLIEEASL
ncbi:MAG: hypothetical protein J6A83_04535 [Clostridia bacterium]|nr:hypothetical protein [Clostridia bacterium]